MDYNILNMHIIDDKRTNKIMHSYSKLTIEMSIKRTSAKVVRKKNKNVVKNTSRTNRKHIS